MEVRKEIEGMLDAVLKGLKHGAALTKNTADDSFAAAVDAAFANTVIRNLILDRAERWWNADQAMPGIEAMDAGQVEAVRAEGINLGNFEELLQILITSLGLFRRKR